MHALPILVSTPHWFSIKCAHTLTAPLSTPGLFCLWDINSMDVSHYPLRCCPVYYSVSILFQSIHSTAVPGRFSIQCAAAQESLYALHSCPATNLPTRLSSCPQVLTCPAWTVPIPRLSEYLFRSCPALSEITPWLFLYPLHGCPSYHLFIPELSQYPLCSCPACPLSTPQLSQ